MSTRPKIGISANFFHEDPKRPVFKGKVLVYYEEEIVDWVIENGGFPFLIPRGKSWIKPEEIVEGLDGVLFTGGADVSPLSYGEQPLRPEWSGDKKRDEYEIAIFKAALKAKKPVLGVCRGIQILNVAMGGTLYQDISTQVSQSLVHRNWDIYDDNLHEVLLEPRSWISKVFNKTEGQINSVHHQGIKNLAHDWVATAWSKKDKIIEAAEHKTDQVWAVQWHPEWHHKHKDRLLPANPILKQFMLEIEKGGRK